jgi:hypothetical protein
MTTNAQYLRRAHRVTLALVVAVVALIAVSCGSDESSNDSSKLANDLSGAMVLAFPDGFSNLAAKCFGTTMVFSTYHANDGRAVAVAPGHEWCTDGVLTVEETLR